MISERLKGQLDGVIDNVKREREEIRQTTAQAIAAQLQPVIQSKDAEISRLQTELNSKSTVPVDGESAVDFADRIGSECVDYLNAALGYM